MGKMKWVSVTSKLRKMKAVVGPRHDVSPRKRHQIEQAENLKWQQETFVRAKEIQMQVVEGIRDEEDFIAVKEQMLYELTQMDDPEESWKVTKDKLLFLQDLLQEGLVTQQDYHAHKMPLLRHLASQDAEIGIYDFVPHMPASLPNRPFLPRQAASSAPASKAVVEEPAPSVSEKVGAGSSKTRVGMHRRSRSGPLRFNSKDESKSPSQTTATPINKMMAMATNAVFKLRSVSERGLRTVIPQSDDELLAAAAAAAPPLPEKPREYGRGPYREAPTPPPKLPPRDIRRSRSRSVPPTEDDLSSQDNPVDDYEEDDALSGSETPVSSKQEASARPPMGKGTPASVNDKPSPSPAEGSIWKKMYSFSPTPSPGALDAMEAEPNSSRNRPSPWRKPLEEAEEKAPSRRVLSYGGDECLDLGASKEEYTNPFDSPERDVSKKGGGEAAGFKELRRSKSSGDKIAMENAARNAWLRVELLRPPRKLGSNRNKTPEDKGSQMKNTRYNGSEAAEVQRPPATVPRVGERERILVEGGNRPSAEAVAELKKKLISRGSIQEGLIDKVLAENIKNELAQLRRGPPSVDKAISNDQIEMIATRLPADKGELLRLFRRSWVEVHGDRVLAVVQKELKDHVRVLERQRRMLRSENREAQRVEILQSGRKNRETLMRPDQETGLRAEQRRRGDQSPGNAAGSPFPKQHLHMDDDRDAAQSKAYGYTASDRNEGPTSPGLSRRSKTPEAKVMEKCSSNTSLQSSVQSVDSMELLENAIRQMDVQGDEEDVGRTKQHRARSSSLREHHGREACEADTGPMVSLRERYGESQKHPDAVYSPNQENTPSRPKSKRMYVRNGPDMR